MRCIQWSVKGVHSNIFLQREVEFFDDDVIFFVALFIPFLSPFWTGYYTTTISPSLLLINVLLIAHIKEMLHKKAIYGMLCLFQSPTAINSKSLVFLGDLIAIGILAPAGCILDTHIKIDN